MSKLLPGPDDLRALPPRAVIAFAARCCRRIQPLYELPSAQPHPATLEAPIHAAEAFAQGRGPATQNEVARLAVALSHAANAARAAGHAWSCMEPWQHRHRGDAGVNAAAAYAECEACDHRRQAAEEAVEASRAVAVLDAGCDVAALAAQVARAATHVTASHVVAKTRPAVAADFLRLQELFPAAKSDGASDPFDPSDSGPLGPLWPIGEPAWAGVRE